MTGARQSPALTSRLATADDAVAIARIHNQGIAERIASFRTETRTVEDVRTYLSKTSGRFPTVVIEDSGDVIAWAPAGTYRDTQWYAGIGEHSVYVDADHRGKGAGLAALNALCTACAARGFWKLISRVFPENVASLRLHERAGFRVVGVYHRHGKLGDEWRDCVIVEKLLDGGNPDIEPPGNQESAP